MERICLILGESGGFNIRGGRTKGSIKNGRENGNYHDQSGFRAHCQGAGDMQEYWKTRWAKWVNNGSWVYVGSI